MISHYFLKQESEPDIIDGVGAETGHVIKTTIGGRNGQSKQVGQYFSFRSITLFADDDP